MPLIWVLYVLSSPSFSTNASLISGSFILACVICTRRNSFNVYNTCDCTYGFSGVACTCKNTSAVLPGCTAGASVTLTFNGWLLSLPNAMGGISNSPACLGITCKIHCSLRLALPLTNDMLLLRC